MDSISYYSQTVLNGILAGCIYALFAMGLTLIYGVLNFVNFAHGELIMWGAYFLFLFMAEPFGLPLYFAILPALALTGCLGLAMEYSVFRPIRRANRLTLLIAAMGLSVFLRNAAQFFWGAEVRTYGFEVMQGTRFFGLYLTTQQFAIIGVTILCVAGVYLLFFKSRLGKSMRALSDNLDLARISGIDTKRAILTAWVISAVLAGIGGILLALDTNLHPEMGVTNLIKAFAATLIGGVGNLWGALLGGLLIGLAENIGVLFISPGYKDGIAFVIMVLILLVRPYVVLGEKERLMDLILHLCIVIAIYTIFALSLNVEVGYTGLFNFGHVAFFAIGAYTSALLTLAGVPFVWALLAALLMAGLCGFLLSIPALKLQGDYFGIATLGFGEILRMIFNNEVWLTKGPMGLPGIPRPVLFGFVFDTLPLYLALSAAFALLTFAVLAFVVLSPFGRALKAVRDDETAAEILGKNAYAFKIKSFAIGSVFAGLAGVLWAHYATFISPGDFTLTETILVLLIVVMGGKGTFIGPVVGAVVLIFFQESVRFLRLPPEWTRLLGPLQQMIFGLLLVVLMVFRPEGIIREKGGTRGD